MKKLTYKPPYSLTPKMVNLVSEISDALTRLEYSEKVFVQSAVKSAVKSAVNTDERILDYFQQNPTGTVKPLAEELGPSRHRIRKNHPRAMAPGICADLRPEQEKGNSNEARPQPQRGGRIPARGIAPGIRTVWNTSGLKDRRITEPWDTLRAHRGMRWSFRPQQHGNNRPTQGVALGWNAMPPWGLPFRGETR